MRVDPCSLEAEDFVAPRARQHQEADRGDRERALDPEGLGSGQGFPQPGEFGRRQEAFELALPELADAAHGIIRPHAAADGEAERRAEGGDGGVGGALATPDPRHAALLAGRRSARGLALGDLEQQPVDVLRRDVGRAAGPDARLDVVVEVGAGRGDRRRLTRRQALGQVELAHLRHGHGVAIEDLRALRILSVRDPAKQHLGALARRFHRPGGTVRSNGVAARAPANDILNDVGLAAFDVQLQAESDHLAVPQEAVLWPGLGGVDDAFGEPLARRHGRLRD